ncbi:hypothetical protein M1349_00820 [Patescibacteria group bacterium]|nr:hypothetical protein [Patescibacteria group bacterium]
MTATGHAVIGTVIAAKIGNPAVAVPIAIASHVIADIIPHWDPGTNRRKKNKAKLFIDSMIDVILGLIAAYFLTYIFFPSTNLSYVFLIIISSQLLDWLMAPYYFFGVNFPFIYVYKFQKLFDNKLDKPWGIITQAVFLVLVVLLGLLV